MQLGKVTQNDGPREGCHQTSPSKETRASKEEAVPEVHAGHAENPTSKESAHMRQPEKEIIPLPLRGHLGDQVHFEDHRQLFFERSASSSFQKRCKAEEETRTQVIARSNGA